MSSAAAGANDRMRSATANARAIAVMPASSKTDCSVPHLHIASWRVLDRRQNAAAGFARRHGFGALRLDPVEPVGPPRARMFLRLGKPTVEAAERCATGPVLVFRLARRIDDARDMTRAGQHVAHRAAEEFRSQEDRLCRRDVVLAGPQIVDRRADIAE